MEVQREFKVNNFDLLRLIAATQVIFDHYYQHLNIKLSSLATQALYLFPGVPVFFFISGYLISASYERNSSLSIYFKNRALRIFPGLWGCVFLTIIVFSITGVSFFNMQVIAWLPAQLVGLIYTPHFLDNYGFGSYNGSLWTIPVELQFYLVLPICYLLAPKNKINYWFYGLLALFISLNAVSQHYTFNHIVDKLITYSFVPQFYMFLIGVIFQRLRLYSASIIYNKALPWVLIYTVFSFALPDVLNPIAFSIIKNVLLAFAVLSLAYSLPTLAKRVLRNNDVSYGIYIYHGLILNVIIQLKLTGTINLYALIGITYIFAYLSWVLIEKPFIRKKEKTIRETA